MDVAKVKAVRAREGHAKNGLMLFLPRIYVLSSGVVA